MVWFGEMLPEDGIARAMRAAAECDVFLSIGTSSVVEPAASLPVLARDRGAMVIEVNPQPTPLTSLAQISIRGTAGAVLPELFSQGLPA